MKRNRRRIIVGREDKSALNSQAAEKGHQMAADQLRLWSYADKLMNQGELARNASFMEVMQTIISKAEGGDEEAQTALG